MRRRQALIVAGASLLSGCSQLLGAAVTAGEAASWLSRVLTVAEGGAARYFDRHPSEVREAEVAGVLTRARLAAERLRRVGGAAERQQALAVYLELYNLLRELGVLDAIPPLGGAESDAPMPGPLALPDEAAARRHLGVDR